MYARFTIGPAAPAVAELLVASFADAHEVEFDGGSSARNEYGAPVQTDQPVRSYAVELPDGLAFWLEQDAAHVAIDTLMEADVAFSFFSEGDMEESPFIYDWAPGRTPPAEREANVAGHPVLSANALQDIRLHLRGAGAEALTAAIDAYLHPPADPYVVPSAVR